MGAIPTHVEKNENDTGPGHQVQVGGKFRSNQCFFCPQLLAELPVGLGFVIGKAAPLQNIFIFLSAGIKQSIAEHREQLFGAINLTQIRHSWKWFEIRPF